VFAHKTVVDASAPVDIQPVSGEQGGLTAQVQCPVRSAPLADMCMRRAQIVYLRRVEMGAAGLHVGTNDLLKFADEIIRRETTVKDDFVVDHDGLIAQASRPPRSVPLMRKVWKLIFFTVGLNR
jgi:hypothetical protein